MNPCVPAQPVKSDQPTDGYSAAAGRQLVQPFDRLQADDHVRPDDALLHERQQIAAAPGKRGGLAALPRVGGPRNGLPKVPSIYVGKCLHASAPRILSRVIGKSFMRRPIALLTALAIAAGDKALPDSPTLFAP